jgi:uncharacterized membrane protein
MKAEDKRRRALRNPLRSSGGMHEAGRFRRGVAEFLRVPFVITAASCVLGVLVALLDAAPVGPGPLRGIAETIVPPKGASSFVSAVATSLLTVTSITFSVLLLAVQQTASSLTPVVFDQFLRRRANQVYFGFFVGLTAFTFIVYGLAREDRAPVYGAVLTLVFTVVALVALLMLIHATIDEMRPQSVVRSIHELALRAREAELVMLGRTRAERHTSPEGQERAVRVPDSGYVVSLDTRRLARVAQDIGPDAEILVDGRLGQYVVFDEVVARIAGCAPDDDSHDVDVRLAFGLDDIRDVDAESGYSIDQLENIAWATATSAAQSPNTATTAIRALRDLVTRWLIGGERGRTEQTEGDELPVVYEDGAVGRIFESFGTLVVATAESRQAQTCAELLTAFASLAPRLVSAGDVTVFERSLDRSLPAVIQHAEVPSLSDALERLESALTSAGRDETRVAEVRALLAESTRRLLPKASDEPEAAHPRMADGVSGGDRSSPETP